MTQSGNSSANIGTSGLDLDEVRRWIQTIHGDTPGLIWVGSTSNFEGYTSSDADGAIANIRTLERDNPQGIYMRTTTLGRIPINRETGKRGRGTETDSLTLPGFAADIDIAGPGHKTKNTLPPDTQTAMSIVDGSGLPEPTIWVHSGGGLYPWWLLNDPQDLQAPEDLARAKNISEKIQKILVHSGSKLGWHVGGEVGDMARVLRVPGTVNRKEGLARPCRIMEPPSYEFYGYADLEVLVDGLYEQIPKPAPREYTKTTRPLDSNGGQVILPGDDLNARGDWNWILAGHFEYVETKGGTDYWLRVGSTSGARHSATTNHARDEDRFYTWSPESVFTPNIPYNKHAAYTLINFGSLSAEAFRQSTKQLAAEGFGTQLAQRDHTSYATGLVRPAAQVPVAVQAVDDEQPAQAVLVVQADQPLPVLGHDELPEIDLGSEQEAMVEIARVISTGLIPNIYTKDGQLTYVHPKTNSACSEVTVVPLTADLLNMLLAENTRTFKWVSGGKDNPPVRKPCAPSITHLRAVVSKTYWPGVPELTGVVGTPTLRPDGSLIQDCGYDQATGLFYGPAVKVDRVPDTITDEQVRTSREFVFSKTFGEFCWSSVGDFSNFMSLLLSPMLRPYVKSTTPFGMVTATTRGSGKTNLTDAIGLLYGQTSQVLPGRTEELQKKITSILAGNSSPVVVFDNLKEGTTVSSEILATLITKDKWDDRMLGASKNIEATNDRLWLASGNGLTVGGDMASRTVMVRLDPKMARPELRQFEMGQFSDWIREPGNREELLWHLLILVQAWVKAGAVKDTSHTMRGFTTWAQVMGGLLSFHGLTGFLDNADDLAARDTDEEEWGIFLAKWHEVFGPSEQLARQVHASAQVDWVMGTSVDRWARCFITDEDGLTPTPKKLGNMLHGKADRFFGKYILRKRRDAVTNSTMWWVEKGEG